MQKTIVEIIGKDSSAPAFKSVIDRLEKMDVSIANIGSTIDGTLKRSIAGIAGVIGGIKIGGLIKESAQLSQRYDELGIVMAAVGRNAGKSAEELNSTADSVRKMGITMLESRSVVTQLAAANIDLSNATKLARTAQDAAVIGQINSSEALNRLVDGVLVGNTQILKGIGINVNFAQSYSDLAANLGKMVGELSEQEKTQARLNVVLEAASSNIGAYEASMDNAGKQLRSTDRILQDMQVTLGALFDESMRFAVNAYTLTLKEAGAEIDNLTDSGKIKTWGDDLARSFAFAADGLRSIVILFDLAGKGLGSLAAQAEALFRLDFKQVATLQGLFREDFDASIADMSKMRDLVEAQIIQRDLLTKSYDRGTGAINKQNAALSSEQKIAASSAKGRITESQRFVESIRKELRELGKTSVEIRKMEAARLGVLDVTESMIDQLERERVAMDAASDARGRYQKWLQENISITESVMTATERYAAVRRDLIERFESGGIGEDTLNRKLREVEQQLFSVGRESERTFINMDQFAIQAARNIHSAFADYLFDPFKNGLKGMLSGFANTLRRMVAEVAAARIMQGVGAGSLLGLGSSSAMASGMGGSLDFLSVANLGSTVASAFSSGLGTTGLVGSAVTALGNTFGSAAVSSFGAGMSGGKMAAAFIGAESAAAGAGTAASMGASFAAAAGPAIALFAVDQIGRLLAGNKSTGTFVDSVPVIGGFAGALFGRGPLKQRATTLSGALGAEGFEDGALRTDFRAKGGLFRSSKNDFVSIDARTGEISTDNSKLSEFANDLSAAARQLIGLFDETTRGVSGSLRGIASNLDLSTEGLDAFSREIRLVSENGQFLSDEQIAEEIAAISNALANSLMPGLEQFGRRGENALQTITRINAEFDVLSSSALILGKSVAESRAMIGGLSIDQRSSFIQFAGGMEALAQKADFFAQNFLSDSERLKPAIETLDQQMRALGLSAEITRDEFKRLVQSYGQIGGISDELFMSLLNIAPLFVSVKDGLDALNPAIAASASAANSLAEAERLITDRRSALLTAYQRESSELQRLAERYASAALSLRSANDALTLSELSPLTPQQRLEESRLQFNRDRAAALAGDPEAQARLAESARAFLQASQTFNASSAEFVSDFNLVKQVLESAAVSAESEADITRRQLSQLESSVSKLIDIDSGVRSVETAIRELTEAVLQGPGNLGISDQTIRDFINTPGRTTQDVIDAAVRHGVSGGQIAGALNVDGSVISQATGGASLSDQAIKDFFHANINNPRLIYDTAKQYGISLSRVASAAGIPLEDIEKWAKANNLPMFERGTDFVSRGGLAMLHPAEAVTPASHMKDMAREISMLRQEVSQLRREQNQQTAALVNVSMESSKTGAKMIIESNQDLAKSVAWREQARVNLR